MDLKFEDLETQRIFSVAADTGSSMRDVAQSPVNSYILAAFNTGDRPYVLELGDIFEALIVDEREFVSLSPPSSYHRVLAFFCAIYHNLMPDYDFLTGGLLVFRMAASRIPPVRIFDLELAHQKCTFSSHKREQESTDKAALVEHLLFSLQRTSSSQPSYHLDVPKLQPSLLTPPQTPSPATDHLPSSSVNPINLFVSSLKAVSTAIINVSTTLTSDSTSTVPSTTLGIGTVTCGQPLDPNAPPSVPGHLRTGIVTTRPLTNPLAWAPSTQPSSSAWRTRIDAKLLPDWRSLATAGHGGLDSVLRSRRKLFGGSSSSGSAACTDLDSMSISTCSEQQKSSWAL